jgi:hypothetical protein
MDNQILIYMIDQGENKFIEFLRFTGDVVILPQASIVDKFNSM